MAIAAICLNPCRHRCFLTIADVQIEEGCLFIRSSNFKKDRVVPLHVSVVPKLLEYRGFIDGKIGDRNLPIKVKP